LKVGDRYVAAATGLHRLMLAIPIAVYACLNLQDL